MSTHALLGATGATGSAILRCFLSEPPKDLTLNVFIRSKARLIKTFPDLENAPEPRVHIFEGPTSDKEVLQRCLSGADVIHMCIAANMPAVGMTLSQDTVAAIIQALKVNRIKEGDSYKTPTILFLRTASLNKHFTSSAPTWGASMIKLALYHAYKDIDAAGDMLADTASTTPGLLDYIYVDPPALHNRQGTERTGHKLTTEPFDQINRSLNYSDLGVGFCELAQRRQEFLGQGVGVAATGEVRETWGELIPNLLYGVKTRIVG